jgi:CHAD domain-containing protein
LEKQREIAREQFQSLGRRQFKKRRLARKATAVLESIAWPKRHSSRLAPHFAPWCRQQLAAQAEAFFQQAAADPADDRQLHELRKAGKRLRYALELAPSAIAPRVHRRLYEELSQLQERLGEVCDYLVAVERLGAWHRRTRKDTPRRQLQDLLAREQQRLDKSRRRFQRWWSAARRSRWRKRWQAIEGDRP